jgi:hypothetical protein
VLALFGEQTGATVDRHALPVPEVTVGQAPDDEQVPLPLTTDGVQRWVWHGRFGSMLIEVSDDVPYVNGQRVEPCKPSA